MRQRAEQGKRGSWLLRFILWASLLALPCWWVSDPWQAGLASIVSTPFAWFGMQIEMMQFNVSAPFELGLYAAMVLASRRAPRKRWRRAWWIGLPIVLAVEALTVTGSMALVLASGNRSMFEVTMRIMPYLIETIPWVAAPLTWLVMLGPWELPDSALRRLRSPASV